MLINRAPDTNDAFIAWRGNEPTELPHLNWPVCKQCQLPVRVLAAQELMLSKSNKTNFLNKPDNNYFPAAWPIYLPKVMGQIDYRK